VVQRANALGTAPRAGHAPPWLTTLIGAHLAFALAPASAQTPSVINPPRAIGPDERAETAGRPASKLSASPDCEPNPSATPQ